MNERQVKTLAEHHGFMVAMSCLMFAFSHGLRRRRSEESVSFILSKRSQLPLLYDLDNAGDGRRAVWGGLLDKAERLVDVVDCADFEGAMFDAARDFVAEAAERTYAASMGAPPTYNAGSLKYDAPLAELPRNHCNFHIANAVSPRSIFADPAYLPQCFMTLMDNSGREHGYDILRTFTWLNDRPRWLELFPREWHDNLDAPYPEIWGNYGFWGQLVTARGTFNAELGEHVRAHGELKYKPRKSHCSFAAMRGHLKTYLGAVKK